MKKLAKIAAAVLTATALSASHAAGVLIDDFSTGSIITDTSNNSMGHAVSNSGTMIGGHRDLYVEKLTGIGSITSATIGIDPDGTAIGNGALFYSSSTGNPNIEGVGVVRWDGGTHGSFSDNTDLATFRSTRDMLLNFNMFTSGGNAFKMTVNDSDKDFQFTIGLYSAVGYALGTFVAGTGDPEHIIPFGAFFAPDQYTEFGSAYIQQFGAGVNPFDIDAIEVTINDLQFFAGSPGRAGALQLSIDQANVVPEPGSLALVGFGLLGLAAARRRRGAAS